MTTKPYKAMLNLQPDERRALNTLAAITGLTPNRYVEAKVRGALRADGSSIGLTLVEDTDAPVLPGQLDLEHEAAAAAPRTKRRAAKPKQEKTPRRRTGSQGGR